MIYLTEKKIPLFELKKILFSHLQELRSSSGKNILNRIASEHGSAEDLNWLDHLLEKVSPETEERVLAHVGHRLQETHAQLQSMMPAHADRYRDPFLKSHGAIALSLAELQSMSLQYTSQLSTVRKEESRLLEQISRAEVATENMRALEMVAQLTQESFFAQNEPTVAPLKDHHASGGLMVLQEMLETREKLESQKRDLEQIVLALREKLANAIDALEASPSHPVPTQASFQTCFDLIKQFQTRVDLG